MPTLPLLSSREIIRTFAAFGWQEARRKGSHIILIKDGHVATLGSSNSLAVCVSLMCLEGASAHGGLPDIS